MSQETQVKFLYGSNLKTANLGFNSGTIYLDLATGELFYDDPSAEKTTHEKIIDTATLIYTTVGDSLIYPSSGSEDISIPGINDTTNSGSGTSAKLGIAILGSMILGSS